MAISATVDLTITGSISDEQADNVESGSALTPVEGVSVATAPYALTDTLSFTTGTGDNQAEYVLKAVARISPLSVNTVSLRSLEDGIGRVIGDGVVRVLSLRARRYNRGNVYVEPGDSNAFVGPFGNAADAVILQPEGILYFDYPTTGWTVDSSNTNLKFSNSTAFHADVDLVLLGTSGNFS